jgi:arsenical pump membrane protein
LVAGLFVLVEALGKTGVIEVLTRALRETAAHSVTCAVWGSGLIVAFGSNLMNNLPMGLIAGHVTEGAHVPEMVKGAVLIGVDLGPNLSITGSLATILWLLALRREGEVVSGWTFLTIGALVMVAALVCALGMLVIQ